MDFVGSFMDYLKAGAASCRELLMVCEEFEDFGWNEFGLGIDDNYNSRIIIIE